MTTQSQIDIVNRQAQEVGIDPSLLIAIGISESGLQDHARSSTAVQGAFQIQKSTWSRIRPGVPYTTDLAEQAKTAAMLIKREGFVTPELVYTSYNAGSGVAKLVQKAMSQGKDFSSAVTMAVDTLYKGPTIQYGKFVVTKAAKIKEIIGGTNRLLQAMGKKGAYGITGSTGQTIQTGRDSTDYFFNQTGRLLANLSSIDTEKFGIEGVRWLKSKGFKVQNAN